MKYISAMTGKRPPKSSGRLKLIFSANFRAEMESRFPLSANKPKEMAALIGITLSSVQRILAGKTAPTLDTVETVAEKLKINVVVLLSEKKESAKKTGTHG